MSFPYFSYGGDSSRWFSDNIVRGLSALLTFIAWTSNGREDRPLSWPDPLSLFVRPGGDIREFSSRGPIMQCFNTCIFRFIRLVPSPIRRLFGVEGYRTVTLPERDCRRTANGGKRGALPGVQLAAHPATCARLVIIYPGLDATLDGDCRHFSRAHPFRYRRLAERLQDEGVAAVVRLANREHQGGSFRGGL